MSPSVIFGIGFLVGLLEYSLGFAMGWWLKEPLLRRFRRR